MISPLKKRVLVEPKRVEVETTTGLFIPETAKEKPQDGIVLAVGSEVKEVKVGDRILYGKYMGFDIKVDNKDCVMLNEEDILAITLI